MATKARGKERQTYILFILFVLQEVELIVRSASTISDFDYSLKGA